MIATAIVPATTTVIAPVIETMSNYDGVRRRE